MEDKKPVNKPETSDTSSKKQGQFQHFEKRIRIGNQKPSEPPIANPVNVVEKIKHIKKSNNKDE